ncbi:unnamed protein product [Medioppia subpectinata]|uniref:Gustatory receptor n=1 Tax=Medioppia subpectinata TaxID=1979941 RepID=A0A7R9L6Y5_9ACAR|nr:unnamed protein product [Medioppia subpectinata]CAG2115416.1 unnamed protein product [Medioppia subpectinata]
MSKPTRMPYFNQAGGKEQMVLAEGYLPTDKIFKIDRYLRYFGMLSQSIEDYLQGNIRGKMKRPTKRMYGFSVLVLMTIVFARNMLLAFVDDPEIRNILGEAVSARPAKQFTMALTLWSIYSFLLSRLFYRAEKNRWNSWLSPFAVFKGFIPPSIMGLDTGMTDHWFAKTKKTLAQMALFTNIRAVLGSMMFSWVAYARFRSNSVSQSYTILWAVILTVWVYYCSAYAYIAYGHFISLAYYFRMRYHKVNEDIESIIAPDNRMKPNERCTTLQHVLNEHNELCIKIKQYNIFWAKYLMYTYFMFVAVICYTTFQAFFTYNRTLVRAVMFSLTLEAAYLITKVSVGASRMANEAHASYARLIRVTFDKYPVELQIQASFQTPLKLLLRMFIQRLSGPTIGFYCLDLFEITYSTYASIIAALGQNFLLIVDFVRSYAELKEEQQASDLSLPEVFDVITNSTFDLNPLSLTSGALRGASPETISG